MIADLDESLQKLLEEELPVRNGEVEVSFAQPKGDWSTRLSRPTINLFLYDARENPALRQQQWEQAGNGSRRDQQSDLKRSPLRVDCLYMLTTWVINDPEGEHRLLSRCMLALFRFPVLPKDRLTGSLKNQPFPIPARLAAHERLTNSAEVWSALDNQIRPSISYVVTLPMDPWQVRSEPLVRAVELRSGLSALPGESRLVEGTRTEHLHFGGAVSRKTDGAPLPGVSVAVKGTGMFTTTDAQGRYRLGSLPPGEYTLVAWPEEGAPLEKTVAIPPVKGVDYNLEM